MLKRYPYILIFCIALLSTLKVTGQIAMPDNVCVGETRRYRVDQHTGSNYEWKIDGVVVQTGPSNELNHTWDVPNTYTIEVQESTTAGCIGTPSSGQVIVHPNITPTFTAIGPLPLNSLAPSLPFPSSNGISGIWTPASINTSVAGTSTYTFTPSSGQCAVATTLDITVETPQISVTDNVAPVVKCKNITIYLDLNTGTYTIAPSDIDDGSFDNTGIASMTVSVTNFNCSNLGTNNVTLTATDLYGNSGNCTAIVTVLYSGIKFTLTSSDFNGFNISCSGGSDGHIRISTPLESAPLTFKWTGPGGFTSSQGLIRGLYAGEYIVLITDKNNCTVMDTIILTEPKPLGMSINSSISADGAYNINCAAGKTGSIVVSALNNVGAVNYIWNDGYNGESRTDLTAGYYSIIITDANKCHSESTVTLTEPDIIKPVFEITNPFCPDKPDGEIRLTVNGGIMGTDYTYRWSDNSTDRNLSNIPAGIYEVVVGDMNGCSVKASVRVEPLNDMCLIIPGIISPNGDLINDVWNIGNTDLYPKMEIFIYNRWGQLLWRSEQGYPHPWDGTSNGRVQIMDSYHYAIDLHNGAKIIVGTITIVK